MKIDGPSAAQVRRAALHAAAQHLADGAPPRQVRQELSRRRISHDEILDHWPAIESAAADIVTQRRGHLRALAAGSILLGAAMLAAFAWTAVVQHSIPILLLTGVMALTYGAHVLRRATGPQPSLDPPKFFGRKLQIPHP